MRQFFKKIKFFFLGVLIFCFLCTPFFVFAQTDKYGVNKVYEKTPLASIGLSGKEPIEIAQNVVRLVLGFVGIVLFLLILYAGFIWLKSRDNSSEVEKAKNIIENALYGIIIIALAYGISEFIFMRLMPGA